MWRLIGSGRAQVLRRPQSRYASTAWSRLPALRRLLQEKPLVRAIEVHSGFSALVVDAASAQRGGQEVAFDCLWSSSLTSSAIKGKPDIETVTTSERLSIVDDVLEVSRKPVLYDGDTGGAKEIFAFTVRKLERLGVSGVVVEDKKGLKQNSLFGTERLQLLEEVEVFCEKLRVGKAAQMTEEFMIFARLEALIAGLGEEECLRRARAYVRDGGADGVMIHSKEKDGKDIFSFMRRWRDEFPSVPVIAVPTTYNHVTEEELQAAGVNLCIYANQLLRASYMAMLETATKILEAGRAKEVDGQILPTKQMISLIDDNTEK